MSSLVRKNSGSRDVVERPDTFTTKAMGHFRERDKTRRLLLSSATLSAKLQQRTVQNFDFPTNG